MRSSHMVWRVSLVDGRSVAGEVLGVDQVELESGDEALALLGQLLVAEQVGLAADARLGDVEIAIELRCVEIA